MRNLQPTAAYTIMAALLCAAISEAARADLSRQDVRRIVKQELAKLPKNMPPGSVGPAGPPGPAGPAGAQGPAGRDGTPTRFAHVLSNGEIDERKSRGITQDNIFTYEFVDDNIAPGARSKFYCFQGLPEALGGQVTVDAVGRGYRSISAYLDLNMDDACTYIVFIADSRSAGVDSSFYLVTY